MSYGNETDLTINFSDQQTREGLIRSVDSLPFLGGRTGIDQALEMAAAQLFSPLGTSRVAVPRTVVIVSSNCQQDPSEGSSRLNETVALLRRNGVRILVTPVCDDVDEKAFGALVEDEEDIIAADSFRALAAAAERVSAAASEIAGTFATCNKLLILRAFSFLQLFFYSDRKFALSVQCSIACWVFVSQN